MLHITETILVEGRYDKAALASVTDANVIELGGFRLYRDKPLTALIRRLSETCGVIVLTDSDRAGFQLRGYLSGLNLPNVKHAYIPDKPGKERRKDAPSKEGKLGVEGVGGDVLRRVLAPFAMSGELGTEIGELTRSDNSLISNPQSQLSKADLYALGLLGQPNSAERRRALLRRLGLPERLSASALIRLVNAGAVVLGDTADNTP